MNNINSKINEAKKAMKNNEGFTLIELIVVMAIIAILVLLAAPRFLGYTKDAQATAVQQDTKVLTNASQMYAIDHEDKWPVVASETADQTVTVGGVVYKGKKLDEAALLENYVKSTKNPMASYFLITEGTERNQEGEVVKLTAVENKEGDKIFSHILTEDATPVE